MSRRWAAKNPMSGYLVAIAATLVVLLLRLLLSGILGESAYFFPFVIAVTVSAWYGGLKPGLLSTVLGAVFAIFFFVPPYYSLQISDHRLVTGLVFFVIANVTISFVCDALHKALRTLELSEAKAVQHAKDIELRDHELRDAQEQLHLITDTMSALVTRCTRDLKYSWVSKPYADWLRLPREQIVGAPIEEVIGSGAFTVLLPYYKGALKGETVRLELEVNFQTIGPRWVTLPLLTVTREQVASNAAVPTAATSDHPGRILVVDDNKDSAETLSLLLQLMGNEVSVAHDGEQALEMAIELRPAVVLLDIGLPKMNGYEVAREIRAQSWGNDPTLITITGWGQTEDKDLSKQAGFNHHLVKPVDPDLLLKLIEKRKAAHENHSPAV